MTKKDIVDLIYYHVTARDEEFTLLSRKIAKEFMDAGDLDTAQFISNMLTSNTTLVPQSLVNTYDLKYFKQVDIKMNNSIYLPDNLLSEIEGIKNAYNSKIAINRFIFEGSPGTGKTEACKYLAVLLDKELLMLDTNSLIDSLLGETTKNITRAFDEMKHLKNAQNVIFLFDELDAIALDRTNSNDSREMSRATTAMLKELDALPTNITLIATTNLYDHFDHALQRRFDYKINFDCYLQSDLKDIAVALINEYLTKVDIEFSNKILVNKILDSALLPNPGELSNLIKSSIVFSNPLVQNDYLKRLFKGLHDNRIYTVLELKAMNFSIRDIALLLDITRDRVHKELKEGIDE